MSFYSYKNCNQDNCPGPLKGDARGLREKVCVQVKKVYDSCMQQEQLDKVCVTVSDMTPVVDEHAVHAAGLADVHALSLRHLDV